MHPKSEPALLEFEVSEEALVQNPKGSSSIESQRMLWQRILKGVFLQHPK
jgi:hypothetical protein